MKRKLENELDVWCAFQNGEKLHLEDVAVAMYGVDVSSYIKTVKRNDLNRFRVNNVGCDGTAALTLQTLHEMIEPLLNQRVWDKDKGDPNGLEVNVIYYCSPIQYTMEMKDNMTQIDRFYINYTSEFVY